ncbi:hypothetical protein [Desulfogranum japonicum]|uniref:hypothetical protein n=1 Tax=Desulfogranum japonicum TaxID=231447 RepID=UPI0012947E2A|nr:hypothetical protein [Desulfogranum japonicum]
MVKRSCAKRSLALLAGCPVIKQEALSGKAKPAALTKYCATRGAIWRTTVGERNYDLIYIFTYYLKREKIIKMKFRISTLFSICVVIFFFQSSLFAATNRPPFSSVTIYGKTDSKFNRVSLFQSGGSTKPYKTVNVKSNGSYSIKINIPKDMKKKAPRYIMWVSHN